MNCPIDQKRTLTLPIGLIGTLIRIPTHRSHRCEKNTEYFEKQLLDIPNLNDLRTRSIDWHNARFEELIQSESEHSLFSQVSIAGNSQELSKDVSRQLIKWFQENYYRDERS